WFQFGFITVKKIFFLIMHNGIHGDKKGFLTLFYSVYKPFCRIQFLLNKLYCIFLLIGSVFRLFVALQHFLIIFRYVQFWSISSVKGKFQLAVYNPYGKIRNNMFHNF